MGRYSIVLIFVFCLQFSQFAVLNIIVLFLKNLLKLSYFHPKPNYDFYFLQNDHKFWRYSRFIALFKLKMKKIMQQIFATSQRTTLMLKGIKGGRSFHMYYWRTCSPSPLLLQVSMLSSPLSAIVNSTVFPWKLPEVQK